MKLNPTATFLSFRYVWFYFKYLQMAERHTGYKDLKLVGQYEHQIDIRYHMEKKHIYKYKLTHISTPKDTVMANVLKWYKTGLYIGDDGMFQSAYIGTVRSARNTVNNTIKRGQFTFVTPLVQRELKDDGI